MYAINSVICSSLKLSLVRRHDRRIAGDHLGVRLHDRFTQIVFIRDHRLMPSLSQHAAAVKTRQRRGALAVAGVAVYLGEELLTGQRRRLIARWFR